MKKEVTEWYELYRPKTLDEFFGNPKWKGNVRSILENKNKHALLLYGPAGCGKTTLAGIIARGIGCESNDFHEYNAANTRGIDTVRYIEEVSELKPISGPCKVYFFDEAHQFTGAAEEALLKWLEKQDDWVYAILATTRLDKISETVRSRCTSICVDILAPWDLGLLYNHVCKKQAEVGKTINLDKVVKDRLFLVSHRVPRHLVKLLSQIAYIGESMPDSPPEDVINTQLEILDMYDYAETAQTVALCRLLANKDATGKWKKMAELIFEKQSPNTDDVRRGVMGYFQTILLTSDNAAMVARSAEIISIFADGTFNSGWPGLSVMFWKASKV